MRRFIVLLIVVVLGVAGIREVFLYYRVNVNASNHNSMLNTADLIKDRLNSAITYRLNAVEDLGAFITASPKTPTLNAFNHYAEISLKQYPTVSSLQYADKGVTIRYVYPLKGNEEAIGHNLMTRAVNASYVTKAMQKKITVTSDPFITVQGFLGIVARLPLYRSNKFDGLAQEVFDVNKTLKDNLSDLKKTYKIELIDSKGKIFWKNGLVGTSAILITITVGDNYWIAKLDWQKTPSVFDRTALLILIIGITLIGLILFIINSMMVKAQDLTAAVKEKTAALSASEEKFSKAFRHSTDVIGMISLDDQKYVEANDAFFNTFGYDKAEVIGHTSGEFGLWLDPNSRKAVYSTLDKEGMLQKREAAWCTKSGAVRIGLTSSEVIVVNGEGLIVYIWCDITERIRDEEALKHAHDDLETKVEIRTQELSALNQALRAMNEDISNINLKLSQEIIEHNLTEKELEQKNKELEKAYTELTEAQLQIIEQEKMASLGSLVAGVAHEINTPLGIGITSASYLEKINREAQKKLADGEMSKGSLQRFMENITESINIMTLNLGRASELIRNFKQVAVDQSNDIKTQFELKDNIDTVVASLKHEYKKKQLVINNNCPDNISLNSYPGAFFQIFTNFIMNSVKHGFTGRESGAISIDASLANNMLKIIYCDDGIGIPNKDLKKIFDPFFTTNRQSGSSGLGLNIVYNIVTQKFKGNIHCESDTGKGVKFIIELPQNK